MMSVARVEVTSFNDQSLQIRTSFLTILPILLDELREYVIQTVEVQMKVGSK